MGKRHGALGIIALIVLLAGCGAASPAAASSTPPTPIPTATATAMAAPTVTPEPTQSSTASTSCSGLSGTPAQVTQSGDILVSPVTVDGLAYPSVMLPDGTPTTKPYKLTADLRQAYAADFPDSPVTNPSLHEIGGGGYLVSICNTSKTQPHVLQAVTAKITSYTSYTGQLNS